ncbi:TetR/AcrR family transcriptional regulator [Humibacter albus]|uniref:TetR/AcrR family transcriptional regulator n=1 Tax=Humibacter albus TaxID=427754 RepID=UPI0003B6F8C9|nr:TetR/AcrR family transcriptional regulator [Humibacter albus]
MSSASSRRERKKAATRQVIADAARRLFLERGYEAVGVREIADEADVAVTTLFAHFPCKEALVFTQDEDFERSIVQAVTDRARHDPLIPALRREIEELVRHCTTKEAVPVWRMVDETPALGDYDAAIRLRHAESLANAIAASDDLGHSRVACRAIAWFAIDAYSLARQSARPQAALDEVFLMIGAAWDASGTRRPD